MKKLNNLTVGIIVGVILPIILYLIFIMPKMSHFSFMDEYYRKMTIKFLPLFLTRCIFPNAILFFLLIWRNQLKIAKGILISTAVLTGVLVVVNFLI